MATEIFGHNDDFERVGNDDRLAKYIIDIDNNQVIVEFKES